MKNSIVFVCLVILCLNSSIRASRIKFAAIGDGVSVVMNKDFVPVLGKVKKHPDNPLFGKDKPWEARIDNGYPNVIYDPDHEHPFRLWYTVFIVNTEKNGSENYRMGGWLYAYSNDGIKWTKPNLGLYEFQGSKNNNILREGAGLGIYDDIKHEKDISKRYKAMGQFMFDGSLDGVADSPDGLIWNNITPLQLNNTYHTHNNVFFDEKINRYVGITRGKDFPPRNVARTQSGVGVFKSFSQVQIVETELKEAHEPYTQPTFPFHNIYLGIVMIYHSAEEDQTVHAELAWSPDTFTWHRVLPGSDLIPFSPKPQYDSWIVYTGRPVVVPKKSLKENGSEEEEEEEEIRIYYFGGNGPHSGERESFLALATLRPDGYVGIAPANGSAVIESVVLKCTGKNLIVTADVENGGSIYVQIKDGGEEYKFKNCNGVKETATDVVVKWGEEDLTPFVGKDIVIQFDVFGSVLYTFGFSD